MVLPLYTSLVKLDWSLVEAALDLGASPWRCFRQVILPLTRPGIIAGSLLVFIPATGEFVSNDIAEQTEQILKNLSAVLEAANTSLSNVVKTTVFLADMNDFAAMNEVYGRYFDTNKPARATVQAARLPRDARVEIECIAVA